MTLFEIRMLIQPCKNRNLDYTIEGDVIVINGYDFDNKTKAEDYLITIPRTDIQLIKGEWK